MSWWCILRKLQVRALITLCLRVTLRRIMAIYSLYVKTGCNKRCRYGMCVTVWAGGPVMLMIGYQLVLLWWDTNFFYLFFILFYIWFDYEGGSMAETINFEWYTSSRQAFTIFGYVIWNVDIYKYMFVYAETNKFLCQVLVQYHMCSVFSDPHWWVLIWTDIGRSRLPGLTLLCMQRRI